MSTTKTESALVVVFRAVGGALMALNTETCELALLMTPDQLAYERLFNPRMWAARKGKGWTAYYNEIARVTGVARPQDSVQALDDAGKNVSGITFGPTA